MSTSASDTWTSEREAVLAENDLQFVKNVMKLVSDYGARTWLFGGWAEEILGLAAPRPHADVDLLYPAADFSVIDAFLTDANGVTEIVPKRFSHKRAFERGGVRVEILLVSIGPAGHFVARLMPCVVVIGLVAIE
jgi:hypothetical protein